MERLYFNTFCDILFCLPGIPGGPLCPGRPSKPGDPDPPRSPFAPGKPGDPGGPGLPSLPFNPEKSFRKYCCSVWKRQETQVIAYTGVD